MQSAGGIALSRRTAAMRRVAERLKLGRAWVPADTELPDALEDILLGGVAWMIGKQLVADEDKIEDLLPAILEVLVAPYRGAAVAREVARLETPGDHRPPRPERA